LRRVSKDEATNGVAVASWFETPLTRLLTMRFKATLRADFQIGRVRFLS
jgi:hypothetical protein